MKGLRRLRLGGGSPQTLYMGRKSERVLDLFLMQALVGKMYRGGKKCMGKNVWRA